VPCMSTTTSTDNILVALVYVGRMATTWRKDLNGGLFHESFANIEDFTSLVRFLRRVSVVAVFISILQYMGTFPLRLQKVMIHSLQVAIVVLVRLACSYFLCAADYCILRDRGL
jgi:hypothetical protein